MKANNTVLKPLTLIALVGPTHAGKSVWAKKLASMYRGVRLFSSDEERENLIYNPSGLEMNRLGAAFGAASGPAFAVLYSKLEASMRMQHPFLLVDTTGTKDTTSELKLIAEKYNYNLVAVTFDLSRRELLQYAPLGYEKVVEKSLTIFKEESLRNLKGWQRVSISSRDEFPLLVEELPLYLDSFSVIGDIHQQVDKAKALLQRCPGQVIFIGDYLDHKNMGGSSVEETLSFLEECVEKGHYLLKGNHENYIHGRLLGKWEAADIEEEFFNSVPILLANEELKSRFLKLYEYMADWLTVHTDIGIFHISHAPVSDKYYGRPKFSKLNINFRATDKEQTLLESVSFKGEDSPFYSICGHLSHNGETYKVGRRSIFIDTGACLEGALSAFTLSNGRWDILQEGKQNKNLPSLMKEKVVDPLIESRINRFINSGVKFISGTMSPAPAFEGKLETVQGALNLLQGKDITEFIIEPKHMGSRAQAYISEEGVFMTSRNGFIIKDEVASPLYPSLQEMRERMGLSSVILDGELMPWSALGEGLIEDYQCKLWVLQQSNLMRGEGAPISGVEEAQKQIEVFGASASPYFIPFSILRAEKDGEITYPEYEWQFSAIKSLLSLGGVDVEYKVLNTETGLEEAEAFFQEKVQAGMEGVVIKPLHAAQRAVIPYLKVRGKDYLRLVYGVDWDTNEEIMVKGKRIGGKLSISKAEYLCGLRMLKGETRAAMIDMLGHKEREGGLDPRL